MKTTNELEPGDVFRWPESPRIYLVICVDRSHISVLGYTYTKVSALYHKGIMQLNPSPKHLLEVYTVSEEIEEE